MNHSDFKEAKLFIYTDIEREIRLAYASQNENYTEVLEKLGIPSCGGNFLAALGLLCYTEFAGKLTYTKQRNGKDYATGNFNSFFDDIADYKNFRTTGVGVNVYDVFRCGLAHEYYVKNNCTIYMAKNNKLKGIGQESNGKYYFVVEQYFEDFKVTLDKFEQSCYGSIT